MKAKVIDGIKPVSEEAKSKYEFKQLVNELKNTAKNVESFVMAVSLVVVSLYAGWSAYEHSFTLKYAREGILFCSILISIQGALLLWKHINKK